MCQIINPDTMTYTRTHLWFDLLFILLFLSTATPPMANAATRATAARQPTVPPTMAPALEEDTEWIKQYTVQSPLLTYNHITVYRYMYSVSRNYQFYTDTDKSIEIAATKT